jgi:hypothetical protein
MPNDFLRDRIQRKLAGLPDERLYQVLDFVEFLETKYAEQPSAASTNFFTRFAESVEDRLRAGKVSTQTIAEAMNLMHRAAGVMSGVAAAGRTVATDVAEGVNRAATVATSVASAAAEAASRAAQPPAGQTGPTGGAGGGPAGAPPAGGGGTPASPAAPATGAPTPPAASGDRPA